MTEREYRDRFHLVEPRLPSASDFRNFELTRTIKVISKSCIEEVYSVKLLPPDNKVNLRDTCDNTQLDFTLLECNKWCSLMYASSALSYSESSFDCHNNGCL